MTDLSYQTKKVYISKLLAFEEAYTNGEVSVVLEADSEPESQEPAPSIRSTYPPKASALSSGNVVLECLRCPASTVLAFFLLL